MGDKASIFHGRFGRLAVFSLDRSVPMHAHRQGMLLFCIDGGSSRATFEGEDFCADDHHAVAVDPWQAHSIDRADAAQPSLCLQILIEPIWFHEVSKFASFQFGFGQTRLQLSVQLGLRVRQLAAMIRNGESSAVQERAIYSIVDRCFTRSWRNVSAQNKKARCGKVETDPRVRRSIPLLEQSMAEYLSIDSAADQVGLSRYHYSRLFKQQMGVAPNIYLRSLRAEKAIEDLAVTLKPIGEIGAELGFSSEEAFCQFFASTVGMIPSEYRAASRAVSPPMSH